MSLHVTLETEIGLKQKCHVWLAGCTHCPRGCLSLSNCGLPSFELETRKWRSNAYCQNQISVGTRWSCRGHDHFETLEVLWVPYTLSEWWNLLLQTQYPKVLPPVSMTIHSSAFWFPCLNTSFYSQTRPWETNNFDRINKSSILSKLYWIWWEQRKFLRDTSQPSVRWGVYLWDHKKAEIAYQLPTGKCSQWWLVTCPVLISYIHETGKSLFETFSLLSCKVMES